MGELKLASVAAHRKGRGRCPCEIEIALNDDGKVVLRAVDKSGTPALVAVLEPEAAEQLLTGLTKATAALNSATKATASRTRLARPVAG